MPASLVAPGQDELCEGPTAVLFSPPAAPWLLH
jgi:hypothetical protein